MSDGRPDRGETAEEEGRELPEGADEAERDLEEMEEEIAPFTERKKFSRESTSGTWRHDSGISYDGGR